ncbi:MAG: CBS domain-containing protein [Desulfobacteraceae bacterium]|nr:MAG: CBS domain-containing protein [Desulfobacteraceae bacterium]
MNNFIVKDLMVPLSEYATVQEGSTLFEAVLALEKIQEEFDREHAPYQHRAVLILNRNKKVIGKLSQLGVLRAILPQNERNQQIEDISRFGFSAGLTNSLREKNRLEEGILNDIYKKAVLMKVEDYMQTLSEGEYVDENTSLDTAIYQLVTGTHLSLIVTRRDEIIGLLRMSDVFAAVFHAMKSGELTE